MAGRREGWLGLRRSAGRVSKWRHSSRSMVVVVNRAPNAVPVAGPLMKHQMAVVAPNLSWSTVRKRTGNFGSR